MKSHPRMKRSILSASVELACHTMGRDWQFAQQIKKFAGHA